MTSIDPDKTYQATDVLYVGAARAANPGDPVHGSTVLANGWQDQVEPLGAPAAAEGADSSDTGGSGDQGDAGGKEPTIKAILDDVGSDKELAAAALDAENAKPEDDRRTSLVAALEKIIAADDAS